MMTNLYKESESPIKREVSDKSSWHESGYDCLEENTQVLMANGSLKEIKCISMGELVHSANGCVCQVRNILTQNVSDCYKITYEDRNAVTATVDHPFLTDNGWKRVNELKVGDMLLDEGGNPVCIERIEKADGVLKVISLVFDSPTILIANGVQSGDFYALNGKMPE